jgi:hypothetical protein
MDQTCPALKTPTESRPQGLGMRRLRAYRKEWDSHGADSFLTFACSNYTPPSALPTRKRGMSWVI